MTEEIIKYMDVNEFIEEGYLQELNRRFLHPLGLAIECEVDEDGEARLGRVWDYRDDPEGLYFEIDPEAFKEKAERIEDLWTQRRRSRGEHLGYMIQPYDD